MSVYRLLQERLQHSEEKVAILTAELEILRIRKASTKPNPKPLHRQHRDLVHVQGRSRMTAGRHCSGFGVQQAASPPSGSAAAM